MVQNILNLNIHEYFPPGYPRFPIPNLIFCPKFGPSLPKPDINWPPVSPLNLKSFISLSDDVLFSGKPNYLGLRVPVYSKLNISYLRFVLKGYHDASICDMLEFGFPLGYNSHLPPVSQARNHSGAFFFPSHVDNFISKEVRLSAVLGPFSYNPFEFPWPCAFSPINTVPKKDSAQRRIIIDLSWPIGQGVNSHIDKDSYLGEPVNLCFPSVDEFGELMLLKGYGCLMYKIDLARAYRQLPICPGDIPLSGFIWRGLLYFDRVLTFGLRSAALDCQRTSNCFRYLMENEGYTVLNYMDDFGGIETPYVAFQAFHHLKFLLRAAGVEESLEKEITPSTGIVFLGILFNSITMTMSIPPEKITETLEVISTWMSFDTVNLKQVQSLVGKLQFIAKCVKPGRIFLSRILIFLSSFNHPQQRLSVDPDVLKDLFWWASFLEAFNGVSVIPFKDWAEPDAELATDACLLGAGGICGTEYFHSPFPGFIASKDLHINCLELLTVTVSLKLWGAKLKGFKIQIFCDNSASVMCINSGKCKCNFMVACLREITFHCSLHNCQILALHLPGVDNRIPDLLSRWDIHPKFQREFFERTAGLDLTQALVYPSYFNFSCNW